MDKLEKNSFKADSTMPLVSCDKNILNLSSTKEVISSENKRDMLITKENL